MAALILTATLSQRNERLLLGSPAAESAYAKALRKGVLAERLFAQRRPAPFDDAQGDLRLSKVEAGLPVKPALRAKHGLAS